MRVAQNLNPVNAYCNLSLARQNFQDCLERLSSSLKSGLSDGAGNGGDTSQHLPPGLISGQYFQGTTVDVIL